ncbi:MAG: hypothetical protein JWP15_3123 [Alphaproteobacteria bacterium]|nr:hypothetical protein [Alphaproteobacteria bacterium]
MASRAALDLFGNPGIERREPRYSLLLCVKLQTGRGTLPAKLRDLSLSGALVEGYDLPPAGSTLFLVRGDLELSARVAWQRDNRAGLEFHIPLTEEQLVSEVNPSGVQRPSALPAAHC